MSNSKGNIFIITLLVAAIILIVFFAYYANNNQTDDLTALPRNDYNYNSSNPLEPKPGNTSIIDINTKSNFDITSTVEGINFFNITNSKIAFNGDITAKCSEKTEYFLINPEFFDFTGTIDLNSSKIKGNVKTIQVGENILTVNCLIELESFENLQIRDFFGTIEQNNVSGILQTQELNKNLDKAFIRIQDFNGNITIKNKSTTLNGTAKEIRITQNQANIILN